ncbi:hypothetical protein ACF0H5_016697 [Mactra antiquata]
MTDNDQSNSTVSSSLKIGTWDVTNVIDWLEKKNLQKFIHLFKKHHVTGSDLINLHLPFLEDYENISAEERETILSEIYSLLNPSKVFVSEEDITKIQTPEDKMKYIAAVELAQTKSASLPRSMSVFTFPPSQAPPRSTSSSSQPSPLIKPRHKSESAVESDHGKVSKIHSRLSETRKRKTLPKILSSSVKPMYEYIKKYGSNCVKCIELSNQQREDLTLAIDNEGHASIKSLLPSLEGILHKGDRVIEINGHMVRPHIKVDAKSHLTAMLNYRSPATLVILTKHIPSYNSAEERWQTLYSMLTDMKDTDKLPIITTDIKQFDHDKYFNDTQMLQEQIKKLEEKIIEQQNLSEDLKIELEDKDAIMHDLELSRDKAIEKLRQTRNKVNNRNSRQSVGGGEYYNMTINALDLEDASKEKVMESLKEIVTEASKQKWYLDRLISLVIEESPWLLDEVDSEFDTLALTDDSEEFC